MDYGYLLRILARRKWMILIAMLAAAVATFLFIGTRSERYKSSVVLSTGIVNYKGINADNNDAFVQQYQVENAFSNLIEFAQSRSSIKLLSVEILRHDLAARLSGKDQPFRQANPALVAYPVEDEARLLAELQKINLDSISEPAFSAELDYLLDKVARAYGYDHDALSSALAVKRKGSTDNLLIELITEKPALSKYMANAFANRFIVYYQNLNLSEKRKSVVSLEKQMQEKKMVADSAQAKYFSYLARNGLPALGKQSEELVTGLSQLELDRQKAESKRRAAEESVTRVQTYMDDRSSLDAGETKNRVFEKSNTDDQLEKVRALTKKSLGAGGKDADVEAELAAAKRDLEKSVRGSARTLGKARQTDESRRTREDLYKEKISYDLERIDAEKSIGDINREIGMRRSKLSAYATNDENATKLAAGMDLAQKELDAVNDKLIDAKMRLEKEENPRKIIENAQLPEWPESNKRTLLSIFAGIVIGTLATILILVLAYFDRSLRSAEAFKRFSNDLPFLGAISKVPVKGLDFQAVFEGNNKDELVTIFREGLRKVRSALIHSNDHVFLLVSTQAKTGKTFTGHALAFSLAANNKRVLILDTNFKNPLPEAYINQPTPNAPLLNEAIRKHGFADIFQLKNKTAATEKAAQNVDIVGNSGLQKSPSEILDPAYFQSFLATLREQYDFIFLEAPAMNICSDTQELLPFVDKVIPVFNATNTLGDADKDALEYLHNIRPQLAGAILTEVDGRDLN